VTIVHGHRRCPPVEVEIGIVAGDGRLDARAQPVNRDLGTARGALRTQADRLLGEFIQKGVEAQLLPIAFRVPLIALAHTAALEEIVHTRQLGGVVEDLVDVRGVGEDHEAVQLIVLVVNGHRQATAGHHGHGHRSVSRLGEKALAGRRAGSGEGGIVDDTLHLEQGR